MTKIGLFWRETLPKQAGVKGGFVMRLKHPIRQGVAVFAAAGILMTSMAPAALAKDYWIGDGDLEIEYKEDGYYINGTRDEEEDGNITIHGGSSASGQTSEEEQAEPAAEEKLPDAADTVTEDESEKDAAAEEKVTESDEEEPELPQAEEAEESTEAAPEDAEKDAEEAEIPAAEEAEPEKAKEKTPEKTETAPAAAGQAVEEQQEPEEEITYQEEAEEPENTSFVGNVITIINNAVDKILNITFDNVKIDASKKGEAAVTVKGDGDIRIELEGESEVKSGNEHAGIEKNDDASKGTLTITDKDNDGSLKAIGGTSYGAGGAVRTGGAGIGSSGTTDVTEGRNTSNITIEGGTIEAVGGADSAGIGGGAGTDHWDRNAQKTTIAGGNASNITIRGGNVTATAGSAANPDADRGGLVSTGGAGIGGGSHGDGSDITISGGTVTASGAARVDGKFGGAGIGGGNHGNGSNITITGEGTTVNAQGGSAAAGIGGGDGSTRFDGEYRGGNGSGITIEKGSQVTAVSGGQNAEGAAGIGGGMYGNGSDIKINDSKTTVTAEGNYGAGIGGGYGGNGTDITITGGTVTATGGKDSAGIGGGSYKGGSKDNGGKGSDITIRGGNVTAVGGKSGAGIGGGMGGWNKEGTGNGSHITISGSDTVVNATGGASGAGIGGGCYGDGVDITISGGTVHAGTEESDAGAAGIGGGFRYGSSCGGAGTDIKITGGTVNAAGTGGSAGIGGSANSKKESTVTIDASTGDTVVNATTMGGSAAIGNGGDQKDKPNIVREALGEVHKAIVNFFTADGLYKTIHNTAYVGNGAEHHWDSGTVLKAPTCLEKGEMLYTCTVGACGATTTAEIDAAGHSWTDWIVTKTPTCTEAGERQRECTACHKVESETVEPTGHLHTETRNAVSADCTASGYSGDLYCADCDALLEKGESISALGHSWGTWSVTEAPTDTQQGTEERTCERCGSSESRTIAPLGLQKTAPRLHVLDKEEADRFFDTVPNSDVLTVVSEYEQATTLTGIGKMVNELTVQGVRTLTFVTPQGTASVDAQALAALLGEDGEFRLIVTAGGVELWVNGVLHNELLH